MALREHVDHSAEMSPQASCARNGGGGCDVNSVADAQGGDPDPPANADAEQEALPSMDHQVRRDEQGDRDEDRGPPESQTRPPSHIGLAARDHSPSQHP